MNIKLIIKGIKLKIKLNRLSRLKENAYRVHMGLEPILPWYETCYVNCMQSIRNTLCMTFCPCCVYDRFRHLKKLEVPRSPWKRLCRDGTFENEMLACFLGFLGGVLMTMFIYFIMAMQLEFQPMTASIVCSVLGIFITFGMAFSQRWRCVTLLMIPQLFSSKGRSFILLYIMILVMTHPVVNFNRNIMVMSNTATCGQQLAYNQTKELVESATAPLAGIMGTIKKLMTALTEFSKSLRESFKALKKAVEEISAVIDRVFVWLASIEKVCNDKMGAPYRKCKAAFNGAYQRCTDTLPFFLRWLCKVVEVVSNICHIARAIEALCFIAAFIKNFVVGSLARPFRNAISEVYDIFYFNVSIYYKFSFNATQSKTYSEVKDDILREVEERLGNFTSFLNFVDYFMMFAVTFVFIKAMLYRYKYLTKDSFDNVYLTFKVRDIDERRIEIGKESIMPLDKKESCKYINSRSIYMAMCEKRKLAKGLVMLLLSMCHAGFYMACDSALYWLLHMMKTNLSIKTKAAKMKDLRLFIWVYQAVPAHLKMHVEGQGALADMYRALLSMFDPLATDVKIDTAPCLPNPHSPNLTIYEEIGMLYGLCVFLVIFEAYGLRLRHIIAGCYYPDRERARAVWLYNHIIKTRGGMLKYTRRQLRRTFGVTKRKEEISLRGKLAAHYPILRKIFTHLGWNRKSCLSCGKEGRMEDEDNFLKCANKSCQAVYCIDCFTDLNNLCTVCMDPIDYGDFSDCSEERDSSEDEEEMLKRKIKANKRKERLRKQQEEKTPENQMKGFRMLIGLTDSKIQAQADEMKEKYLEAKALQDTAVPIDGTQENVEILIDGGNGKQPMDDGDGKIQMDDNFSDDSFESEFADDYQYVDKRSLSYLGSDDGLYDQNYDKKSRKSKHFDLVSEDIFEKEYYDEFDDVDNMSLTEPGDIEMERGMNSYDKFR